MKEMKDFDCFIFLSIMFYVLQESVLSDLRTATQICITYNA